MSKIYKGFQQSIKKRYKRKMGKKVCLCISHRKGNLTNLVNNLRKSSENYNEIYFTPTKWVKNRNWTKPSIDGGVEERGCSHAGGRLSAAVLWDMVCCSLKSQM